MNFRISFLTLFALIIFTFSIKADTKHDIEKFEKIFNLILHDLDSIISNSENQHEIVQQHFEFVKNKVYNGKLGVVYDTTLNYDFYGCSAFNVSLDDNSNVNLSFGNYIIDKYKDHPSLVYAIIINSFQNAYDYYNNKLFMISSSNEIEKTYFETDALTLEAIFLFVYMKNFKGLGYLEKYLMADLQNNMAGSVTLFKKTDLDLLHRMDNLKSLDKSSEKLLKEFDKIGKELIKTTTFDSESDWGNYCNIVTLKTYIYYSEQVIFDIVYAKDNINLESFSIENYPKNMETINEIKEIIGANSDYLKYHNETMQLYSNYYN